LQFYDLRGRVVRTLVDAKRCAGHHGVVWDGCDQSGTRVSSGLYTARRDAGGESRTQKLVVIK